MKSYFPFTISTGFFKRGAVDEALQSDPTSRRRLHLTCEGSDKPCLGPPSTSQGFKVLDRPKTIHAAQ